MTAILVLDGEPVAHGEDYYSLLQTMLDARGPFTETSGYSRFYGDGAIDTVDKLSECFDIHAGIYWGSFDLLDKDGEAAYGYIISDPFYIFEAENNDIDGIFEYCEEHGIKTN